MPKFAVYYVPAADDELYRLGSAVVGYDIRNHKRVQTLEALQQIPKFTDDWLRKARPYGFHLTIGDSIDFEAGKMAEIQDKISEILGCFNPKCKFALHQRQKDFVTYWRKAGAVVLRYDPNDDLKVLHALIAALIHPLGTGSGYLRRHLNDPKETRPYRVNRMLRFYSPTIFDSYAPHFTLLHPYTGQSKKGLTRLFSDTFSGFDEVVLHSVSLLIQSSEEDNWRIHREFKVR